MNFPKRTAIFLAAIQLVLVPVSTSAQDQTCRLDIFEEIWTVFNTNYPYFSAKGIDWDAIHEVYRTQITDQTSDEELFEILSGMLGLLNDAHINLSNGNSAFNAGLIEELTMNDFSESLVRTKYLKGQCKSKQDSNFVYGWLSNEIAYLRIRGWKQKEQVGAIVDSILAELELSRGMVIDVRNNTGGNAYAAEAVANRFADCKRLCAKNYLKRGPGHDSLFPPEYAYVQPDGPVQFTGPIMVLQHRFSESATERFILAMRVLPHAALIGELTSGCFGNYYPHELSNGWTVSMAWSYEVDQNGTCWVGIGIPPNLRIVNTADDIGAGNDRVLEFAMDLIKRGGHFGKEADGSLRDMRSSMYKRFIQIAFEQGVPDAVAEFHRIQIEEPDEYYFSAQECLNGIRRLMADDRTDILIAIMNLAHETWPEAISFPYIVASTYKKQGMEDEAAAAYRLIADKTGYFPWDKSFVAEAKQFLADR